jgi:Cu2+-exporting ATPase
MSLAHAESPAEAAGVQPPPAFEGVDPTAYVRRKEDASALHLMVEGIHCPGCVNRIETAMAAIPGVVAARVNLTTRRLALEWRTGAAEPRDLVAALAALGYRAMPYDPERLGDAGRAEERNLLRALAVAGFAAANVMLLSVAVWAGASSGMGPATRDLLHWISALVALPAVAYAGQPFLRSALGALSARRLNMDVPITLAVALAAGMSLAETVRGGEHVYFDAAVTLLFFLLIGRYLDLRARAKACSAAEHLLALTASAATVVEDDGSRRAMPPTEVGAGMTVAVAAGERIAVDGVVSAGASDIDGALVTGESTPYPVAPGERVFAGTLNLTGPLSVRVTAAGEDTLLSEIVRLMEAAEQGRARYVRLADRLARIYAPVVHILGAATFLGWLLAGAGWQSALLTAVAVLIITCPCALGLAVPVVQVVASGRLLRAGVLVKSGDALERLAQADRVVFDKTGTLTLGDLELREGPNIEAEDLRCAVSLAATSSHPLARALARAAPDVAPATLVREVPGAGLAMPVAGDEMRLGSRAWCGVGDEYGVDTEDGPELWLARPDRPPVRFAFADAPRPDAAETVRALSARGLAVELLSGDREPVVERLAARLGIDVWRAGRTPAEKVRRLDELAEQGHRVLMVGDGLNDAPALAAATVSISPAAAADVSQTAADLVFQGKSLAPVVEALEVARRADRLVRQNFTMALLYNAVAVPLAVMGLVTPLIAAIAMSLSSLAVSLNALRLWGRR